MAESSNERLLARLPTAEELAMLREAYAETYPVRPLLNEIERLTRVQTEMQQELLNAGATLTRLRALVAEVLEQHIDQPKGFQDWDGNEENAWIKRAREALREESRGVSGVDGDMGCPECGGALRVAEVTRDGSKSDRWIPGKKMPPESETDALHRP